MTQNPSHCRLCGGKIEHKFFDILLQKYKVDFFECQECHSLQTESPYWLDEAYTFNLSILDTGAVQRNLQNFAYCLLFSKIFNIRRGLDYGSSDGLLCRFLRDHGVDFYAYDKYSKPIYAQGFTTPPGSPDLVTAFEVLEHFSNPAVDFEDLIRFEAKYILFSTEIYTGQRNDWWYLAKETGQHVFFYSPNALERLAKRARKKAIKIGANFLFYDPSVPRIDEMLIQAQSILSGWVFETLKPHVLALPGTGVGRDMELMKNRIAGK